MVWLRALVSLERRIEVSALHGADRPRDITIAGVRDALPEAGDLLEEWISVPHRQWTGCGKDGGDLTVGQPERHGGGVRGECFGIRDLASLSKSLARNRKSCACAGATKSWDGRSALRRLSQCATKGKLPCRSYFQIPSTRTQ
jgi:hypothetical protein